MIGRQLIGHIFAPRHSSDRDGPPQDGAAAAAFCVHRVCNLVLVKLVSYFKLPSKFPRGMPGPRQSGDVRWHTGPGRCELVPATAHPSPPGSFHRGRRAARRPAGAAGARRTLPHRCTCAARWMRCSYGALRGAPLPSPGRWGRPDPAGPRPDFEFGRWLATARAPGPARGVPGRPRAT